MPLQKTSLVFIAIVWLLSSAAQALRANKVWMEFRTNGRYRVFVNYTVPELRSFREVYVDFSKKQEAEKFYFDVLRGAEFSVPDAKARSFTQSPTEPEPW
jgi:hypothetical protein